MTTRSMAYALFSGMLQCLIGSLLAGLLSALLLGAVVLLLARGAQASQALAGDALPPAVEHGMLLLRTAQGLEESPAVHTEVQIRVTGMIARARVRQRFHNPGAGWVEGVYVFPLPEGAAVDHLRMRVGEREIEGVVREREQARRAYEAARAQGRKASLMEQERPNIFTTSVANLGPGEDVEVEIQYQETVRYDQGSFHLRFPMVVGPRYIPGSRAVAGFAGTGWATNTDQVPDASRITPPVVPPAGQPVNPVSLSVELDPGMALERLESSYHRVRIDDLGQYRRRVTLAEGPVPADRDFELTWRPAPAAAPRAALFTEQTRKAQYGLLMIMPPQAQAAQVAAIAREVVFVIDTSGSMHGNSISQARQALEYALTRLRPGDAFNIIQFNSVTRSLFNGSRAADPTSLALAQRYAESLEAEGGTEMAPAIEAALSGAQDSRRIRQVVFLTDGAVGNETALFARIEQRLGDSRLFTVGIGSAPNSHFMTRAAHFGRGTFTYIGRPEEVQSRMQALFQKLESPVLSDIELHWPQGTAVEAWPRRIPDLYAGEPLLVAFRAHSLPARVEVTGKLAGSAWRTPVLIAGGQIGSGISKLWARRKIAALMDGLVAEMDPGQVQSAVVAVALAHHLASRYTSLVAVDVTPSRPDDAPLSQRAVPTNLPHGWSYEHVFGRLPQTATPARLHLLLGLAGLLVAWWLRRGARSA